ncbi:MAG: formate dehydrogenase accessory sulfurtransferase FdhD [Candidatus Thorarchaeota archaeon]|jgi:FdhD protein
MRPYRSLPTQRLDAEGIIEEVDLVAIETALEVRINKDFIAAFVCSPGHEKELSIGYLLSTGIIKSIDDIDDIRYSANRCIITVNENIEAQTQRGFSQIRRFIGTECSAPEILRELRSADGVPTITNEIGVEFDDLYKAAKLLRESQTGRQKTGALHGSLVKDIETEEYSIAEDLGRHNAVDKAIGIAVERGFDLTNCILISSGRLTADIVSKCAWASIPLLVSFAVSTDAGVKFAQKANLTLVGSFKGRKMRIYNQGAGKIQIP